LAVSIYKLTFENKFIQKDFALKDQIRRTSVRLCVVYRLSFALLKELVSKAVFRDFGVFLHPHFFHNAGPVCTYSLP
jgi:hypothetical protein